MCTEMQAPPADWFDTEPEPEPTPKPETETEPETEPEWMRMLRVYRFLFEAHEKEKSCF